MQKQRCKMSDCDPIIRQALNNGGEFSFYPRGKSMEPTICEGRDKVFLMYKCMYVFYGGKNTTCEL